MWKEETPLDSSSLMDVPELIESPTEFWWGASGLLRMNGVSRASGYAAPASRATGMTTCLGDLRAWPFCANLWAGLSLPAVGRSSLKLWCMSRPAGLLQSFA
jgi:hypothetical protein